MMEYEELLSWHPMHTIRKDVWIYFDPTNRFAALVDEKRRLVCSVMDRKNKEIVWENKNAVKSMKFRGRELDFGPFVPRRF